MTTIEKLIYSRGYACLVVLVVQPLNGFICAAQPFPPESYRGGVGCNPTPVSVGALLSCISTKGLMPSYIPRLSLDVEIIVGTGPKGAATSLVRLANRLGIMITSNFNKCYLVVMPGDKVSEHLERINRYINRK